MHYLVRWSATRWAVCSPKATPLCTVEEPIPRISAGICNLLNGGNRISIDIMKNKNVEWTECIL